MPTLKPRITITLTEHQHEVLHRMSKLGGDSMSAIVVDMLDTVLPMLERVVATMQAAADAPKEVKESMKASFGKAEQEVLPQLELLMGQLDGLFVPAGVSALAGAPAGSSNPKPSRPPTSNRGVRIPPSNPRKPRAGAASKAVGKGTKK